MEIGRHASSELRAGVPAGVVALPGRLSEHARVVGTHRVPGDPGRSRRVHGSALCSPGSVWRSPARRVRRSRGLHVGVLLFAKTTQPPFCARDRPAEGRRSQAAPPAGRCKAAQRPPRSLGRLRSRSPSMTACATRMIFGPWVREKSRSIANAALVDLVALHENALARSVSARRPKAPCRSW